MFENLGEIKKTQKSMEWWTELVIYKFSTPLVSLLKDTSITANQLTLISLSVVIIASFIIALGNYAGLIIAAILLQISFILDNADGQLARYRKQASAFGHWLDSTCDRLCELFILMALTYRFSFANDKALFFGFFSLFLIYYYNGLELRNPAYVDPKEKNKIEAKEGAFFSQLRVVKNRLKWIPFNTGEQYFLFSLFLVLNRIDLFFYFFICYGSLFIIFLSAYKYYQYRLLMREGR
ncbi:MAG: CDP-alcohol phosphatidyltransferase family protein [Candidatus Omnitrophica bacterium]|nr:CDP-alcohol phosphatidyltransferase family protein [Candidatus Omnitrophota bacterium]